MHTLHQASDTRVPMAKLPIRAIFLIKDPHRSPDVPHRRQPFEFIAALRARPGIASLSNARRALAGRFSICLAHDSSEDGSDSMLGVRVLHFELRALSPGADAPRACQDALDSMRLSPKGLGRCLPIPPPDGTGPELDFGERPAVEALAQHIGVEIRMQWQAGIVGGRPRQHLQWSGACVVAQAGVRACVKQ